MECPTYLAADSADGSKNDSGGLLKIGQTVASMFCDKFQRFRK